MMRQPSWSMRFALALSVVFALGTLAAGGLSYFVISQELSHRLARDVRTSAEGLARIADAGDRTDLEEQIAAQVRAVGDASTLFAYVDAMTGQTTGTLRLAARFATPFTGARDLVPGRDFLSVSGAGQAAGPDAYSAYGVQTRIGWVIVARDTAWVTESTDILLRATALAIVASLLLSLGLAYVIARRNEARITGMETVLDAIGQGALQRRIGDSGTDDIADLSRRVDRMLDRLEAGIHAIRQVSTDVAHDLRAPLQRLRMRLEPQALSADLPDEARHEIGSALQDIDAISATFDAILRLARLQSGTVTLQAVTVDLAAIARDVHDLLEPTAAEAGHVLSLDPAAGPALVQGDAGLLAQAVVNLVDNALRHCPAPARITVAVRPDGAGPVLTVSDDGPGIPAPDRARVLDRFVRLDASRSVAGTGLGLSLVASIAKLHGAAFELADNTPGLTASLLFPPADGHRMAEEADDAGPAAWFRPPAPPGAATDQTK
ncbi:sensor histidine kinase [Paragemmobacter straminiformis]|uniref:histidine kinase n=1 Tax=Paragemmobacter straminiformis TaxID=2045119 RepID=A0A842I4Y5_9RHOB|nr:HAMP domain-containing sensor histidine kinase [Gemmobacter straminiformis]MBC2834575.1 HAMP domain-containing histidine kinase [Gemmobacter straminiformis]